MSLFSSRKVSITNPTPPLKVYLFHLEWPNESFRQLILQIDERTWKGVDVLSKRGPSYFFEKPIKPEKCKKIKLFPTLWQELWENSQGSLTTLGFSIRLCFTFIISSDKWSSIVYFFETKTSIRSSMSKIFWILKKNVFQIFFRSFLSRWLEVPLMLWRNCWRNASSFYILNITS